MEQFLELSHHMPWNDGMLKVCFWSGLDNPISHLMPMEETSCTLTQYMDYALWLSGSSYTVGDAEGPNPASPEPSQSTSILPKPLGSSPPRASRICPRPLSLLVLHFEHSVDTGAEEQSNRRINPLLNTLHHAGGPGGVKYTVP